MKAGALRADLAGEADWSLCECRGPDIASELREPNSDVRQRRRDQEAGGVKGTGPFAAGLRIAGDSFLGSGALMLKVPLVKTGVVFSCDPTACRSVVGIIKGFS